MYALQKKRPHIACGRKFLFYFLGKLRGFRHLRQGHFHHRLFLVKLIRIEKAGCIGIQLRLDAQLVQGLRRQLAEPEPLVDQLLA